MSTKPDVNGLDLDALAAETSQIDPYTFILGGEKFTVADPDFIDWKLINDADDDRSAMLAWLGEEQYTRFCIHNLRRGALRVLMNDIERYYASGEGDASPTS